MKTLYTVLVTVIALVCLATVPVFAAQQEQLLNAADILKETPLVLHIVSTKYPLCKQMIDKSGASVYGTTVYASMTGKNDHIMLQVIPGKRQGERADFQVTDPCTADLDGSAAEVQIPKDAPLYMVFAKVPNVAAGKYVQTIPRLMFTHDASGNSFLYLGKLTNNGIETVYGDVTKKQGQWAEMDIAGLLEWEGSACYPKQMSSMSVKTVLCCASGLSGDCTTKTDFCPLGTKETLAYCDALSDAWLFSVPSFANYIWTQDTKGQKTLEIYFFPVN